MLILHINADIVESPLAAPTPGHLRDQLIRRASTTNPTALDAWGDQLADMTNTLEDHSNHWKPRVRPLTADNLRQMAADVYKCDPSLVTFIDTYELPGDVQKALARYVARLHEYFEGFGGIPEPFIWHACKRNALPQSVYTALVTYAVDTANKTTATDNCKKGQTCG